MSPRPRSRANAVRALLLLVVLTAGAWLPAGAAQQAPTPPQAQPTICFDRDPPIAGRCAGTSPPSYLEGDAVTIDIDAPLSADVSARCMQGCPSPDPTATRVYWASYGGADLVFPRDFNRPGPQGNGVSAAADGAPRYNSTWEITVHLPGAAVSRTFFVWLYDSFSGTNFTVRPGENHYLRAAGFTPGGEVSYRWERRDPFSGRYDVFLSRPARAQLTGVGTGWFEDFFELPPSAAQHIAGCGLQTKDCYRVIVGGAGKTTETVNVQVGLADIKRSLDTTPRPAGDLEFQRTQNATFHVDLYYPGGRLHHGPKLTPTHVPDSPTYGGKALRVAVEKLYPNGTLVYVGEVPARYDPAAFHWMAQWTIPKDLPPERNTARYRLRLVEQQDAYGNRIVEDILGNFTVDVADLRPRIGEFFRELERTDEGILRIEVLYHNGTPFTPDEAEVEGNQSPLRGCFLRVPAPPPPPATPPPQPNVCGPNDPLTWGKYYDGAWNFTVRYPRDYPDLDHHRFVLSNGTTDRWSNNIWGLSTSTFRVVPAKPTVNFTTVMRGEDSEVLERGTRVFVSATITYGDGTPYNHRVRANPNSTESTILSGRLLRRGPAPGGQGYGPLAGEEVFNLTQTDSSAGRWSGDLQLHDDDTTTPVGIWTFQFDVRDNVTVPNVNLTSFDREIVSSSIVTCPTFQPPGRVPTGSTVKFRFKLFYSECDGREVASAAIEGKLTARVHRYDPATRRTFGDPLSNVIVPTYAREAPEGTRDWTIQYEVPNHLFAGAYAIALAGADIYGNKLLPTARSREFSTYTEVVQRSVLANPPPEVRRGESATVVFDARERDTGVDPRVRFPRIQLERFDTSATNCANGAVERGCWVRERADVRVPDPTLEDHVGVFAVDVDTPVGLYRFALQGRDATFHIITAVSSNFSVGATTVTRALMTTPPERVVKGEPFTFYLEQLPGDELRDRVVFFEGRGFLLPPPQLRNEHGRANITWAIPFEAPTGNYTLRIEGRDVNGNNILVLTPPIEALAASLEGRVLGQPTRSVQRGDVSRILFAIGYPDGGFYAAPEEPRVFVHSASGVVAAAKIRREGLSFAAEWTPPKDMPIGEYYFEVSPQPTGDTGNAFPSLRSQTFRVIPGKVVRNPLDSFGADLERLQTVGLSVPMERGDKSVGFELVYYGPSVLTTLDTQNQPPEITRSPLSHTIDVDGGRYVARLVTDQQSQTGTFKIHMTGEDAFGNRIESWTRQFVVRATTVSVQFDRFPAQSAFGEGKTITLSFVAKYGIGAIMDESFGRPSVVGLFNERPITQRPEVEYANGRWFMTWTAPDVLPPGSYQFAVGGFDIHGNPIANARSIPYVVQPGSLAESASKLVPGPDPVLVALVVAGLAAILARRRAPR